MFKRNVPHERIRAAAGGILTNGVLSVLDRGYTSHEHFSELGIIHMNGRLYDPLQRRFLNADENIQDPYNTQCYNKYGYVTNNPLLFNDPNGEFFGLGEGLLAAVVIGALIGTASYMIGVTAAIMNGADASLSLSGMLKSAFWGAVSGAATFGIGSCFTASATTANSVVSSTWQSTKFLVQAAAHGVAQGALAMMQNGGSGFLSGAAGGFFGSLGATAWSAGAGKFASSRVGTISFGALSGGVGAELSGGNFWQGAVTGGIVAGLNDVLHKFIQSRYITKQLISLGKDPDARAQIEESQLGDFAEDMFPKMMEQADDPYFRMKDKIISPNGDKAYGQTVATTSDGITHASHIEISRSALISWRTLASTIGHEINHYYLYNTGVYDRWVRAFGEIRADALNEYKAHGWEQQWGGSPDFEIMNTSLRIFKTGR